MSRHQLCGEEKPVPLSLTRYPSSIRQHVPQSSHTNATRSRSRTTSVRELSQSGHAVRSPEISLSIVRLASISPAWTLPDTATRVLRPLTISTVSGLHHEIASLLGR